jgi:hypothetical protein
LQWGGGGGVNLTLDGAFNMNPANASISIAPTGTGTLTINPATAGTINNMAIGGTTPAAGAFTTLSATSAIAVTSGGTGQTSYTDGQLLIGNSTGNTLTKATLTAGTGVTITNGSGAITINATGTGGDVVGPASATNNGIVLFNSTTGKIIKDSGAQDGLIYGITVGRGAGASASNTAFGASALAANSGTNLVAVGSGALQANTTGNNSVAVGERALNANTTGSGNVAVGEIALFANLVGADNVAIGYAAAQNNTASNNVAIGRSAFQTNTSGASNTAVGYNSLFSNTTASNNTAVGYQSLFSNITGTTNTAVGGDALKANLTSSNTAIGYQAGTATTTGNNNVYIGQNAGSTNITGTYNCYVGGFAGYVATGSNNTFVGASNSSFACGSAVTTGAKNTILGGYSGNQDGLDIRTASNYAVISDGDGNRLLSTANGYSLALDGGAVPVTGTGITFPATQSASSDANTLDDYEEGTWTPTYVPTTNSFTSITYAFQSGKYTKVGNLVTVTFRISTSALTVGTASGILYLGSLPFTPNGSGNSCVGGVRTQSGGGATWGVNFPQILISNDGVAQFSMGYVTSSITASATINVTDLAAGSGNVMAGTVTYNI